MKTVTPMDLRRSLGRILDEASAGERFLIERDHKPLAVLVSVEDASRLEDDPEEVRRQREAAFEALDDWGRRYRAMLPPDHEELDVVEWLRRDRESH
jgi:antitoxin (DNA-binding transcriptional repressor) of toxin-antitoxin stability system